MITDQLVTDYIANIDNIIINEDELVHEEDLLIQSPENADKIVYTYYLYSLLIQDTKRFYVVVESATAAIVIKPDSNFMKEHFPTYV